ncbi:hypothetical protein SAMN02745181_1161 [Rubritalea squalenifaciens DSM 18772]|uniref:Uncharacterized protein n=1 Tax=Rubritalea squalenifaciens DSM 18772 TaxID=1123071 RepID=A0A1M6GG43_9BACT|nr:hypothetical protein [Rubritalea squalenifaciens]SHJ08897.1 hypothetical protein SAMN02745181_1161 [Rubritalea squalenifaciens DSM 18772]
MGNRRHRRRNSLPPTYSAFAGICYIALILWIIKDLWVVVLALLAIIYLLLKIDRRNR